MTVCQKCGKENAPDRAVCSDCGTPLSGKLKANLAGTMLGMPSPVAPGAGAPPKASEPTKSPSHSPANEAPGRKAFAGTMLGMPSPVAPSGSRAPTEPAATPGEPTRPKVSDLGRTMVGMGAPVDRPPPAATGAQPRGTLPHQAESPTPAPQNKKFQGTLLGVAQPGIAPSPGALGPAPPRPGPTGPTPQPTDPPTTQTPSFASQPVTQPFPTTRPVWKTALMIGGGMALAAAIGGGVALLAPKPVTVVVEKFSIDDDGNDQLELRCDDCPPGSELILGEATTAIDNKRAVLTPETPLALGRNELEFTLKVGDDLREAKKVILPIAFRVLTKWTGLHESPPYGMITVAAPEGSSLSIDGKNIPLKGEMAEYRVDFTEESTGESTKVQQVSSEHDIVVTVDGKARETRAILQNGVTPLTLSSPGSVHELGGKPVSVSGRTSAGATVTIGKEKVVADDKGSFTHIIESPEPGALSVAARSEKFLTRQLSIELTDKAPTPNDAVTQFGDLKPGVFANLRANVIESRTAGGTTQALLEVESDCEAPPCLLRAVYGEPKKLAPNRPVQVIGTVAPGSPLTVKVTRFR